MLRTLERAKAAAEMDTRRRRPSAYIKQIESQLSKEAVDRLLALDSLRACREPMCDMSRDIRERQTRIGKFVGQVLSEARKEPQAIDIQGLLFGIVQAIQFGPPLPRPKLPKFSFRELTLRKIALNAVDFVLPDKRFVPDDDFSLSPMPLEFDDDLDDLTDDLPEVKKKTKRKAKSKTKAKRKKIAAKKKAARR
ncbi:MAG: hypothetical protein KF802_07740 [Bdellovibrionaceae bacterium]|nr:hypothetical protein [Pseudobdellovibrionaceae bacterium]